MLCEINDAGLPWVASISLEKAAWLIEHAVLARLDGLPAGTMIALDEYALVQAAHRRRIYPGR